MSGEAVRAVSAFLGGVSAAGAELRMRRTERGDHLILDSDPPPSRTRRAVIRASGGSAVEAENAIGVAPGASNGVAECHRAALLRGREATAARVGSSAVRV